MKKKVQKQQKKNWLQTGYNFKNWLQFTTVLVPILRRFSVRIKNWLHFLSVNRSISKTGYIVFNLKKRAGSCFKTVLSKNKNLVPFSQ